MPKGQPIAKDIKLYFSDFFGVSEDALEEHGAFNISLLVDLPLFIDPFLLFNSKKEVYRSLHAKVIAYLRYLKQLAEDGNLSEGRLRDLFCFGEVEQNWLGFSRDSNKGRGLGMDFARALATNLNVLFADESERQITKDRHLEKLCLLRSGVGRDMVSDFTTNLIRRHLCEYTEAFATKHLEDHQCAKFAIDRIDFHEETGSWAPAYFRLPKRENDFVLLTPKDILTKDDMWINKDDFVRDYHDIATAVGNAELRSRINAYFRSVLPRKPKQKDRTAAIAKTAIAFPVLLDYYIKHKEEHGDEAMHRGSERVALSSSIYVKNFGELIALLKRESSFYDGPLTSRQAALEKARFLKDIIENKGGYRLFYHQGVPIRKEEDLQICYRLVWHQTRFDVTREANDGRGPADFKISFGSSDKTIVEMKLASNSSLRRNLEKQAEIYQTASDAHATVKVIIYFSSDELARVMSILRDLKLLRAENIVLIDARSDNKPSASKA